MNRENCTGHSSTPGNARAPGSREARRLLLYLSGELPGEQRSRIEKALPTRPDWHEWIEDNERLAKGLREGGYRRPAVDLVAPALKHAAPVPALSRPFPIGLPRVAVAAGLLAMAGTLFCLLPRPPSTAPEAPAPVSEDTSLKLAEQLVSASRHLAALKKLPGNVSVQWDSSEGKETKTSFPNELRQRMDRMHTRLQALRKRLAVPPETSLRQAPTYRAPVNGCRKGGSIA